MTGFNQPDWFRMRPTKFNSILLLYCGILLILQGIITVLFVESGELTLTSAGGFFLALNGVIFIIGSRQFSRQRPTQSSQYGWSEYIIFGFAVVLTGVFFGSLTLL